METVEVVAAIILNENQILCMQRGACKYDYLSYKYEFPGGKVQPGETLPAALMRELREEMDLDAAIRDEDFYKTVHYQYPDFQITLHFFFCQVDTREFVRKEHEAHQWLGKEELGRLEWAGADEEIIKELGKGKGQGDKEIKMI